MNATFSYIEGTYKTTTLSLTNTIRSYMYVRVCIANINEGVYKHKTVKIWNISVRQPFPRVVLLTVARIDRMDTQNKTEEHLVVQMLPITTRSPS